MHVIYRKTLAKNFRYTTNIYNHRYGCNDEEAKNKNTLELYINKAKMYYVSQHIKPNTYFYLDLVNVSLGYFAVVVAIAELQCIITNNKNEADITIDRIELDNILSYNIVDSKKCTSVNKKIPTMDTPLYKRFDKTYTHRECFDASRINFDDIKGEVLIVSNDTLIHNLLNVLFPVLINSNIGNRLALGYYNFEDAKHKIAHTAIHHSIDQIFLPSGVDSSVKKEIENITPNVKIRYFCY